MNLIETGSSGIGRLLRSGALSLLAVALVALAALSSPVISPVAAQETGVEFLIVEGRKPDGGGGRFVTASSHTISEGLSVYYFIKLRAQPSANVDVTPASSSSTVEVNTGSDNPLTFTPENWSSPQTVQVFTYAGAADDGNAGSISHTISSQDPSYNGLTPTFTVNIIGVNSNCTPSAAPSLTVSGSTDDGFSMEVVPSAASCGNTPIIGYDTAIREDTAEANGEWEIGSNTRAAYPSGWTYSVQPVVHWYDVSSGSTYTVKLRGITYKQGTTPWSSEAEVTVPATTAPELIDANPGAGGL